MKASRIGLKNYFSQDTRMSRIGFTLNGGARRDRTDDLNTASVALSQLSYGPTEPSENLKEAHASNIAVLCQLNGENSSNPEVSVML